ncbi:MAG: type II secretion system protein J [Bryobacteraceae bacterium]
MSGRRGVTLMEVLIAVSLLSLLSVGMLMAMRVGLNALGRANERLMENRRVASVERILESQIAALMPVMAQCLVNEQGGRMRMPFFQGEPRAMRFVSSYSLEEAWRGRAQILEYLVIPGENGRGVRLVVNEIPYANPYITGLLCLGRTPDPATGTAIPRFRPIEAGPRSFVLADRLAECRFLYLGPPPPGAPSQAPDMWRSLWILDNWPAAVRVEMVPLEEDAARLRPVTLTVPVRIRRSPEIAYGDY